VCANAHGRNVKLARCRYPRVSIESVILLLFQASFRRLDTREMGATYYYRYRSSNTPCFEGVNKYQKIDLRTVLSLFWYCFGEQTSSRYPALRLCSTLHWRIVAATNDWYEGSYARTCAAMVAGGSPLGADPLPPIFA